MPPHFFAKQYNFPQNLLLLVLNFPLAPHFPTSVGAKEANINNLMLLVATRLYCLPRKIFASDHPKLKQTFWVRTIGNSNNSRKCKIETEKLGLHPAVVLGTVGAGAKNICRNLVIFNFYLFS